MRLENISIENCNLTKNASPLVVHGHVKNLTLFQLSFKDNVNLRKAATIRFSRRMSGSLNMTSVTFERNSGAHSIARLPKHTYMRDVVLENNNCRSPIFAFPKDSDISISDFRAEFNKNTVLMLRNSNLTLTDSYFGNNGENMVEMEGTAFHVTSENWQNRVSRWCCYPHRRIIRMDFEFQISWQPGREGRSSFRYRLHYFHFRFV